MEGRWKFCELVGSQKPKFLKESMKPNWNFQGVLRGGGGGGGKEGTKNHLLGRCGYFLEQHNVWYAHPTVMFFFFF